MKPLECRARTKRIVLYAIGCTILLNLGFSWVLPWWHPDTEYRLRRAVLRDRIAEHPEQPLMAFVGSSHVANGFNPHDLSGMRTATDDPVLAINFAHLGAGPVLNLVQVKRLLQVSRKPRWLVVEVFSYVCADEKRGYVHMVSWNDLGTISHYHSYRKYAGSFLRNHFLVPWHRHRGDLQEHYLYEKIPLGEISEITSLGWLPSKDEVTDEERRQRIAGYRELYRPTLGDTFQIASSTRQAYHELLALCRDEGIKVALILMPEGESFRSWYSPVALDRLQGFLQQLSEEHEVRIFDTRQWFDDTYFTDSHHLLNRGSREFTRRLERELLQPWIRGELPETSNW